MEFFPVNQMQSVYEGLSLLKTPDSLYDFFMENESEVVYFVLKGMIQGVVSIGDLERYYIDCANIRSAELKPNTNFFSVEEVDYKAARDFFKKRKTINEVPVISDGKLRGIIKTRKSNNVRKLQRSALAFAKSHDEWHQHELERFIKNTKAKVLVYTINERKIKEQRASDWAILERRAEKAKEDSLNYCGMSEKEWERFWSTEYKPGIVEMMKEGLAASGLKLDRGQYIFDDLENEFCNYKSGCRITVNTPTVYDRSIYMYGVCTVRGEFCKDEQTIASILQEKINHLSDQSVRVVNKSIGTSLFFGNMFMEELSKNDLVIFFCHDAYISEKLKDTYQEIYDLTDVYLQIENLSDNIVDNSFYHCNYKIIQKLANRIWDDILQLDYLKNSIIIDEPVALQNYYIQWQTIRYFENYFQTNKLERKGGGENSKGNNNLKIGSIVMNCNPFTNGHRYLIEQALSKVDRLYIFVVEEDRSYFKFKDRYKMVKLGVQDLKNVKVVPSGQYIISGNTFSQYFEKEQVKEIIPMDYDIQIFGDVVAKYLGIQYRFVGEEPYDNVTKAYNETMKKLLPDFGIEVIEIPRKQLVGTGEVISASSVRKALQVRDWNKIEKMCTGDVLNYLRNVAE